MPFTQSKPLFENKNQLVTNLTAIIFHRKSVTIQLVLTNVQR